MDKSDNECIDFISLLCNSKNRYRLLQLQLVIVSTRFLHLHT